MPVSASPGRPPLSNPINEIMSEPRSFCRGIIRIGSKVIDEVERSLNTAVQTCRPKERHSKYLGWNCVFDGHTLRNDYFHPTISQLRVELFHNRFVRAACLHYFYVVLADDCTKPIYTKQCWLFEPSNIRKFLPLANSSGYSGSPRFSPNIVRLTPNG